MSTVEILMREAKRCREELVSRGRRPKSRLIGHQLLTHLYWHQHAFYRWEDDLLIFPTYRLARILGVRNERLRAAALWARDNDYVGKVELREGELAIQLLSPTNKGGIRVGKLQQSAERESSQEEGCNKDKTFAARFQKR